MYKSAPCSISTFNLFSRQHSFFKPNSTSAPEHPPFLLRAFVPSYKQTPSKPPSSSRCTPHLLSSALPPFQPWHPQPLALPPASPLAVPSPAKPAAAPTASTATAQRRSPSACPPAAERNTTTSGPSHKVPTVIWMRRESAPITLATAHPTVSSSVGVGVRPSSFATKAV